MRKKRKINDFITFLCHFSIFFPSRPHNGKLRSRYIFVLSSRITSSSRCLRDFKRDAEQPGKAYVLSQQRDSYIFQARTMNAWNGKINMCVFVTRNVRRYFLSRTRENPDRRKITGDNAPLYYYHFWSSFTYRTYIRVAAYVLYIRIFFTALGFTLGFYDDDPFIVLYMGMRYLL